MRWLWLMSSGRTDILLAMEISLTTQLIADNRLGKAAASLLKSIETRPSDYLAWYRPLVITEPLSEPTLAELNRPRMWVLQNPGTLRRSEISPSGSQGPHKSFCL